MSLIKLKHRNAAGQTVESDIWHYRFNYKGKIYTKSTGTSNKTLAARVEEKARKQVIENVTLGRAKTLTTKQAFDLFLDSKKQSGERHNYATYVGKLLGQKFDRKTQQTVTIDGLDGSKLFHEITTADMQKLVLSRRATQKDTTTLHELSTFTQTQKLVGKLGYAVPTVSITEIKKDNKVRPGTGRLVFLTVEQQAALLAQLDGDLHDFVLALLATGARHTEIAKLEWSHVDLQARTISLYRFKVGNESIIPMTDKLFQVLERRFADKRIDQTYVFEDSFGNARQYTIGAFKAACKRAGIKHCTFHTLRHTVASRCAQAGMSLYEIQVLLGHSTPQMTAKYAHLIPSASLSKAVAVLNG